MDAVNTGWQDIKNQWILTWFHADPMQLVGKTLKSDS